MTPVRRIVVANWSSTPPVICAVFGLAVIAYISFLLLPTLPPWRDPDPRQYFSAPSLTALLFMFYLTSILAVMGLAISVRIALTRHSPIHWWALPVVVIPPLVWLALVSANSEHMGSGNGLELPLLGLVVAVFLGVFGGFVRSWRGGAWGTWLMSVVALALWAFVPRLV